MIKPNELTPGKFYEVVFRGTPNNDSFLVVATSHEKVSARWKNGNAYHTTGHITSCIDIIEISEMHYLTGQKPVLNNKEAVYLLSQDY